MAEITREAVEAHFTARAERYDRSSHWVTDPQLKERVWALLQPKSTDEVLDVACGTGLVSAWFHGRVAKITGADITEAMFAQAKTRLDEVVLTPAESLPFEDDSFDIVICRQGTQFMDDAQAIREMVRVLRPGGTVCVINLCAYGEEDRAEYFEILRLRNPARRNFYLREDLQRLFVQAGAVDVVVHDHISVEDVDVWSNNGAIAESNREGIREVYRNASSVFQQRHAVSTADNTQFVDHMLFGIAMGTKPA